MLIDDDTEVEPDLMIRQPQDKPGATWKDAPLPILIVEVESPTTYRRDRVFKRNVYLDAGIPEYWIIDPVEETIEVHRFEAGGYALVQRASGDDEVSSLVVPGATLRAGRIFL